MLTPRQALDKAKAASSDKYRAQLQDSALDAANLSVAADGAKPDCIVGGSWPSKVRGAQRTSCDDCCCYIGLSPDSGASMHAKYPDVPVLCFECVKIRGTK